MATVKLSQIDGSKINTYKTYTDWRRTWHHIVYLPITMKNESHLLLYDRITSEAKVLAIHSDGSYSTLRHYYGSNASTNPFADAGWDLIVSGQFCSGNTSDIFLYNRQRGTAAVASAEADGTIKFMGHHAGWRRSWDIAVAGSWTGSGWHDLLLYDARNGEAKVLVADGNGGLKTYWHFTGWWRDWDNIVTGYFATGLGYYSLLFYRRISGDAVFFQLTQEGKWQELARHTWDGDWDAIVPGRFSPDGPTRLVCYSRRNPRAVLLEVTGKAAVKKVGDLGNWRPTWWVVATGWFKQDGKATDELLLYDNRIDLKIRAIRVSDDDGTRQCPITSEEIGKWVAYANKVYASAGVQFSFKMEDMNNSTVNQLAKGAGDKYLKASLEDGEITQQQYDELKQGQDAARSEAAKIGASAKGSIVVFFTYGPWETSHGGGFSGSKADYVSMPELRTITNYYRDGSVKKVENLAFLAHELGHYLGIPHPFVGPDYESVPADKPDDAIIAYLKQAKSTSADVLDGDRTTVFDTPPDVGGGYYTGKGLNPADPDAYVLVSSPKDGIDLRFSPDRHNVMSYFSCDEFEKITRDQARRIRDHLYSSPRKHLLG